MSVAQVLVIAFPLNGISFFELGSWPIGLDIFLWLSTVFLITRAAMVKVVIENGTIVDRRILVSRRIALKSSSFVFIHTPLGIPTLLTRPVIVDEVNHLELLSLVSYSAETTAGSKALSKLSQVVPPAPGLVMRLGGGTRSAVRLARELSRSAA
jgi:hypothetical protein